MFLYITQYIVNILPVYIVNSNLRFHPIKDANGPVIHPSNTKVSKEEKMEHDVSVRFTLFKVIKNDLNALLIRIRYKK